MVSTNRMANRVLDYERDNTKLGRWAWTQHVGSYKRKFRVVSVYVPAEGIGYNSAYSQQIRYSMKTKRGICPRKMLLIELGEEIKKWKEEGDSIVVIGGWNQDIRTEKIQN